MPSPPSASHPPLQAFVEVVDQMRADPYLSPHIKYYMREMRVVAYAQVRGAVRHGGVKGGGLAEQFPSHAPIDRGTSSLDPGLV